jgi:hypothetical protein
LAIVSSIVTSEVVGGKVDVWSQEGVGTEIKVTFNAEVDDDEFGERGYEINYMEPIKLEYGSLPSISLVGFDGPHRGIQLLERILRSYLEKWWNFNVVSGAQNGDIIILNEDVGPVIAATEKHDISRPFIILSGARGSPSIMQVATEHERIGGFCRILYKPGGPGRLRSILKLAVRTRMIGNTHEQSIASENSQSFTVDAGFKVIRRNSDESYHGRRPNMGPRSSSAFPVLPTLSSAGEPTDEEKHSRPSLLLPLVFSAPTTDHAALNNDHDYESAHEPRSSTSSPDPLTDPSRRKPILEISTDPRRGGEYLYSFEGRTSNVTAPGSPNTETAALTSAATTLFETGAADVTGRSTIPSANTSPTNEEPQPTRDRSQTTGDHHVSDPAISAVIPIGESGSLLKSSIQPEKSHKEKKFRVLVVEDNGILRNLL